MSLHKKFAVLLGLLGLMVVVNAGAALWSVFVLERELSRPLVSIESVLGGLGRIKRALGDQAKLLVPAAGGAAADPALEAWLAPFGLLPAGRGEGPSDPGATARFGAMSDRIRLELAELRSSETYLVRSGISTTLNVDRRVELAQAAAGRWFALGDAEARAAASRDLYALHELIERIEMQILDGAHLDANFGVRVRARVVRVLGVSVLAVLLALGLGMALVRRWVMRPVASLRDAAARIGAGDFAHRLPVAGRDELAMLSAEVNHMASMISTMQEERVDRERLAAIGEMVRRIAHNLRNPLAGIRGLAELTRSDLPADSELRDIQGRIVTTVDRFERWLSDLLSASSPLGVAPERVAVAPWLEGIVETHRPMAESRKVRLSLDVAGAPPWADFDSRHLEQALVAIVTNAIEASPAGTEVRIGATQGGTDGSWQITVADQGAGVPAELLERIFRPYFTTKRTGTGIGLALAQRVVQQHRGQIHVETGRVTPDTIPGDDTAAGRGVAPGGNGGRSDRGAGPGSTFTVRLPLAGSDPMATDGHDETSIGQNSHHRGRREPAILDRQGPHPGRP